MAKHTNQELHNRFPNHGAEPKTKVETFNWSVLDAPGEFRMIHKSALNVDHEYQRSRISEPRVLNIARRWSWAALGVILVAERADGTLWVFDGQHRKMAADKRADIQELPCMVFSSTAKAEEALAFLRANTDRGPMRTIEKFRAMILSGDELALKVRELVESTGYSISDQKSQFTMMCVNRVMQALKTDPPAAHIAWKLTCDIFNGDSPHENIFAGLYGTERELRRQGLGSIGSADNRAKLINIGAKAILRSIAESQSYFGGGDKSCTEGVIRVLNKSRRNRIQTPYESREEE